MIDFFGPADNPDYEWISNEGIVYGRGFRAASPVLR